MNKDLLTFAEAIDKANIFNKQNSEYKGLNVLLANGFSIDCCKNIFTYESLFENANFSKTLQKVFFQTGTNDFEKIIKMLQETSKICEIYNLDETIVNQLLDDAEKIKNELIKVISKKHPEHQHKIKDGQFCSAYKFLSNFENIYTLNYDMLLYWTLMFKERSKYILRSLKIKDNDYMDGFGRLSNNEDLTWYKTSKQNIFYLHGALHLFEDNYNIIKAETTSDDNLLDVIKKRLDNDQYPLIVAEGTSKEKLNKISHNKYLQNAIDQLRYIKGNLFIHGHSLDENDKHIIDIINNDWNLKQIFISVFDPPKNLEEMQQKSLTLFVDGQKHPKKIFLYDAQSANVWSSIKEEDVEILEFENAKKRGNVYENF